MRDGGYFVTCYGNILSIINRVTKIMPKDTPPKNTKKRGRPRVYTTAAERQRAYRQRLRAQGLRVQARVVPALDGDGPSQSSSIDLSACRHWCPPYPEPQITQHPGILSNRSVRRMRHCAASLRMSALLSVKTHCFVVLLSLQPAPPFVSPLPAS